MKVAIGPLPRNGNDDWPLVGSEELAPEFQILDFPAWEKYPYAAKPDVTVAWSPEYAPVDASSLRGYTVAVYGDHHIVPFERVENMLAPFNLIAADWRGVKRLRELGYRDVLYWRQFSFDPRLHFPGHLRTVDVAFWGRPDGGKRDAALDRLKAICQRNGWRWSIRGGTPYKRGEEAHAYRLARIVWNLSARGELNMRAYEAAACGALSMLEMGNDELWQANAPLVPWQDATLEEQLRAWLDDEPARLAKVAEQRAWVEKESPRRHLEWLLKQIKQRMEERDGMGAGSRGNRQRAEGGGDRVRGGVGVQGDPGPLVEPPPENEQRPEVCALVPPTARKVLDLGTHTGGVPWRLKRDRPGIHVTGVDIDERVAPLAAPRMDAFYTFNLTAPEAVWREQPWYAAGGYDCVILADVVEHVVEPRRLVEYVRPLLAPGGVVVASIPQIRQLATLHDLLIEGRFEYYSHGNPEWAWRGPGDNVVSEAHIRFFTKSSIARLFDRCGFRVVRWESLPLGEGTEWADGALIDDLVALVARHGGDADGLREALGVLAWLAVCERKEDA